MRFYHAFRNSLYNVAWLKRQKSHPGQAWSYFFIFVWCLAIVKTVPVLITLPGFARDLRQELTTSVPDFSAALKNGELAVTGLDQPFIHRAPDENLVVVVDTVSTSSQALSAFLLSGESGILVTKSAVEIFDAKRGEGQTQQWKDAPDFSIDKAKLVDWINRFLRPGIVILAGIMVTVALLVASLVAQLVVLLIASLLTFFASAVTGRGWKFAELFTVALYATTLPSLLALVFGWIVRIGNIHFLALLAFLLAIIFTEDAKKEMPAASEA